MGTIKIATWNIEHIDHQFNNSISNIIKKRRERIYTFLLLDFFIHASNPLKNRLFM